MNEKRNIPSLKIQFDVQERKLILTEINNCLESGQVSMGKYVEKFEQKFAQYTGLNYAIATSSGTTAIEAVMRALHINGGEVLVPTNTFMATVTSVLFAGGRVRLVDVNPQTFSVSVEELEKRRTPETVGVVVVHIGGIISPEIDEIKAWCDKNGLWLFEDAAHAHGCTFKGRQPGEFGIAAAYSFFSTKVITSGEGGMVVTNDPHLANEVTLLRNHGKPYMWETYNVELGTNYRMNEFSAIIGHAQLLKLDEIKEKRNAIAEKYTALIKETIPEVELILPSGESSYYKYIVMLPQAIKRDDVKKEMKARGINLPGEVYAIPIHEQPAAQKSGLDGLFPNADFVCKHHICLPIYPEMEEYIDYVVSCLREVITKLK